MILVLGLRSVGLLPVRQYPLIQNAVVTVQTVYYGADPALVAGFITTPLENSIAQANGIDYLTSSSRQSVSTIQANLRLNYDPNKALTEINTRVNAVLNQLPRDAQQPVITVAIGETIDSMYIGFSSKVLPTNKITDYLIRVVQPKLQAVDGVQTAEILGQRQFALRAWLDPVKMAALGVTATDVSNALAANDFISALGRTKGQMVTVDLTADTSLHSVDEFRNLVIRQKNGALVRLGDVANVTLGAEDYDTAVTFDGKSAVYIGIKVAPTANLLTVIDGVRKAFPAIAEQLPRRTRRPHRVRRHKVREQLDPRGGQDPDRGAPDRDGRDLPVPRHGAVGHHPDDRHAALPDRRVFHHARAGLHHQPSDPARAGARHRPRGR